MPQTEIFPEEFAQWMLIAVPSPSGELVRMRWEAVSAMASEIEDSTDDVIRCARILFDLPVTADTEQRFRQPFVQRDPRFANSSNKLEMRLLAGAVLATVMRSDGTAAGVASLAVLAGSLCGIRSDERAKPFVDVAQHERKRIAAADDSVEEWPALTGDTIETIESGTVSAAELQRVAQYAAAVSEFGTTAFARLREEAAIAWWVLGEYSNDFDKPVRELVPKTVPITLAKELADLTRTQVGPVSAGAVLWKMLKLQKKVPASMSLGDAIDALPPAWLGEWLADVEVVHDLDELTPIITACRSRQKSNAGDWRATSLKAAGLNDDPECDSLDLAKQTYFECLLVRALSDGAELAEE